MPDVAHDTGPRREPSYYARSQEAVRLGIAHKLTPYARALLKCIYETDGKGAGCWKKIDTYVEELGGSVRTVQRSLRRLEELGLVLAKFRNRDMTIYHPPPREGSFRPLTVTPTPKGDTLTPSYLINKHMNGNGNGDTQPTSAGDGLAVFPKHDGAPGPQPAADHDHGVCAKHDVPFFEEGNMPRQP